MGFFDDLLGTQPSFVKEIVLKIKGFCSDMHPDVKTVILKEAIFYAENENNWEEIENNIANKNLDAEYHSLFFIYLSVKSILNSGKYHSYAGMVAPEGYILSSIGKDCLDRLYKGGYFEKELSDQGKKELDGILTDIGIG